MCKPQDTNIPTQRQRNTCTPLSHMLVVPSLYSPLTCKMIHISSVYNILLAVSLEINNSVFWDLWGGFICVWVPAFAPVCLHPYVFIREGRPAGTVVVGEGEEPPDGQLWQRGQLWSKAQEEEEERGESSRLSRREKRWSRASEWETQDDGVLKPMVGSSNKQEKHLLLCYHHTESDSLEYIPLAILKYCKYLWTLEQQNGAKWALISFLSDLIYFRNIWSTTERMPTLNQFLH